MIYLDSAATAFQRPPEVIEAVMDCLNRCAANPGRAGHRPSLQAARRVWEARETIADFFHIADPLRVVFTSNATDALNLAVKGVLRPGDHVITTAMEHNSVLRPLSRMKESGVLLTILDCDPNGLIAADEIEKSIRPETKLIICTHTSNLTGTVMPVGQIGQLCRSRDILFLVDASQSAGVLDIDVQAMHIDLLAAAGHKGLLGIQGTGILYAGERAEVMQLKEGGTGSRSDQISQPLMLPDRYESGTLNVPGIVSLKAGIDYINTIGRAEIEAHERALKDQFLEGVRTVKGVRVYGHGTDDAEKPVDATGVVPLNIEWMDSSELAFLLDSEFAICVRAGIHCAPLAHRTLGTLESGAVRFSFGWFNTREEIVKAVEAVRRIAQR